MDSRVVSSYSCTRAFISLQVALPIASTRLNFDYSKTKNNIYLSTLPYWGELTSPTSTVRCFKQGFHEPTEINQIKHRCIQIGWRLLQTYRHRRMDIPPLLAAD